jgi:hypothetical protein
MWIPDYPEVFKRGIAVGFADIKRDEMTFRYKDELFTFPALDCIHIAKYNGYFYEARIAKLRKLAKLKH